MLRSGDRRLTSIVHYVWQCTSLIWLHLWFEHVDLLLDLLLSLIKILSLLICLRLHPKVEIAIAKFGVVHAVRIRICSVEWLQSWILAWSKRKLFCVHTIALWTTSLSHLGSRNTSVIDIVFDYWGSLIIFFLFWITID